ncbi:MAG: hypothetical protein AB7P48_15740, partial [Methylocystis sp.]
RSKEFLAACLLAATRRGGAASAATIDVDCADIARYSPWQVQKLYYEGETLLGAGPARRLYAAYYALKNRCSHNERARMSIYVTPKTHQILIQEGIHF